jgi:release factor glutamine methyltransferase
VRLVAIPGVFRPISDAWLLTDALDREPLMGCRPPARVLDLCSGSGALAVRAALGPAHPAGPASVTAVDISRRAVAAIRLNAALNGVRVRAVRGDLFGAVDGECFDAIVSNPPYVPGPHDALPRRGLERAWHAGRDGRVLLDRICAGAPAQLRPGGVVLLVHSSLLGVEPTLDALRAGGLGVRRGERERAARAADERPPGASGSPRPARAGAARGGRGGRARAQAAVRQLMPQCAE